MADGSQDDDRRIGYRDEAGSDASSKDSDVGDEEVDDLLEDEDLRKRDQKELEDDDYDGMEGDFIANSDSESGGSNLDSDKEDERWLEVDKRLQLNKKRKFKQLREQSKKWRRQQLEKDGARDRHSVGRNMEHESEFGSDDAAASSAPAASQRSAASAPGSPMGPDAGSVVGGGGGPPDDDGGDSDGDESSSEEDDGDPVDFAEPKGELNVWLTSPAVQKDVKRKFRQFIRGFREDPGGDERKFELKEGLDAQYMQRLDQMVTHEQQSLHVKYKNLAAFNIEMAIYSAELPTIMLRLLEEVATGETKKLFPRYNRIATRIHVRFTDLPICDPIRNLRCLHMNMLVRINGVVTRRSQVYPQLQATKYDCSHCHFTIGPLISRGDQEPKVRTCPNCQGGGPFKLNSGQTIYRNYQTIVLQESPGSVPPGRLPRYIECILLYDLVDKAKPGDHIEVTGVYKNNFDPLLNHKQGFPVFTSVMEVNSISQTSDEEMLDITEEERQEFIKLSKHPHVVDKIVQSIAPSIHGNEYIKTGIAASLFGAVRKEIGEAPKHRVRGDINVLLVGDPGCGKSQFLKYVEKTSPRAVYTTGRGSTAVGLTAAVHKDSMTGEWTLEGGALVVADKGHCLIDEFDKMSDADRTSIHEAMEQQTISIAKAGIVTTLQARCAIIAAANPISGQYDASQTFEQQVNLTQPILSRFDLLFAVRDVVNVKEDMRLAKFIINSHIRSWTPGAGNTEEDDEPAAMIAGVPDIVPDRDPASSHPLPQDMLRKYILFARSECKPKIEQINHEKIEKLYVKLRSDSAMKYESGVKIVVRHLESILRLSEAFAKMRLSDYVRDDDVNRAISLFLNCFLQTLPHKRFMEMKRRYARYMIAEHQHMDVLAHLMGFLAQQYTQMLQVKFPNNDERMEQDIIVEYDELMVEAEKKKIYDRDIAKFMKSEKLLCDFDIITRSGRDRPIDHQDVKSFRLRRRRHQ